METFARSATCGYIAWLFYISPCCISGFCADLLKCDFNSELVWAGMWRRSWTRRRLGS